MPASSTCMQPSRCAQLTAAEAWQGLTALVYSAGRLVFYMRANSIQSLETNNLGGTEGCLCETIMNYDHHDMPPPQVPAAALAPCTHV